MTILAFLPILPQFVQATSTRMAAITSGPLPSYFLRGLDTWYRAYSSHWDALFAIVIGCAAVGLLRSSKRVGWGTLTWLLAWGVGIPLLAYVVREQVGLFTTRYLVFTIPAIALLLGLGLASFPPRWLAVGALSLMVLAPWQPFDHRPAYSDAPPIRDFMREMGSQFLPGDRLVIDPALSHLPNSSEWAYYKALYAPLAEFRASTLGPWAERRIWFLVREGTVDPALQASVHLDRVKRASWGPWYLSAGLYEAPPDPRGARVGDSLLFHGADVGRGADVQAGDPIAIDLWWSSETPLPQGYSAALRLVDPGGSIVLQSYAPPRTVQDPADLEHWSPQTLYVDHRTLAVPRRLNEGDYTIRLYLCQGCGPGVSSPPHGHPEGLSWDIDRFHLWSSMP
jgi:hypothetical protein